MSSGAFISSRYAASYAANAIHPIKIQPETTGLTIAGAINTPPSGVATNPISAIGSLGRRALGLKPRKVSFKFTSDTPQAGLYREGAVLTLPWLNPFTEGQFAKGATGSYLGEAIEVVSTSPEDVD